MLKKLIKSTDLLVVFAPSKSSYGGSQCRDSVCVQTFLFLVCGFLVMFMAAGFAMLESGMVRSKNAAMIV